MDGRHHLRRVTQMALRWLVPLGLLMPIPRVSAAAPGQAIRLGGAQPQGPATRAITALHHNPAMLGALASTRALASFSSGVDQLWVRPHAIDRATGAPIEAFEDRVNLINPTVHYFAGASFYFDPVAVGVGLYDLSSRYRLHSGEALRYHLAPDPDLSADASTASRVLGGCLAAGLGSCPPDGGSVRYHQDLTIAAAWNAGAFQLGLSTHFPLVRSRFAYDNDVALAGADPETTCRAKGDPACAERVGFKGWTRWIPTGEAAPGFDFAFTVGIGYRFANERVTLGARYRTFPLRRGGLIIESGVGLVCRPDPSEDVAAGVQSCRDGRPTDATLAQRLPQELALGGAFVLGRGKLWRLDTNLYWIDACAGGLRPSECPDQGKQVLSLVGLDQDSFVLPEFNRYMGRQDVYGLDVYASYRMRSTITLSVAGHFASPAIRPDALTAANSDGWRLGTTLGASFRIRQSDFQVMPGYGLDVVLPHHVTPEQARFVPTARTAFEQAGADLNAPGAQAVLAGRARSTNAGRYFGMVHTFTLAFRWAERRFRLD